MFRLLSYSILFCVLLIPGLALADTVSGFGGFATSVMEPLGVLSDFVTSVSLILGVMFIFATVLKYSQHRVNPLAVPLGTVIFLFICGIVLILLPLAYKIGYTQPPYRIEHKS